MSPNSSVFFRGPGPCPLVLVCCGESPAARTTESQANYDLNPLAPTSLVEVALNQAKSFAVHFPQTFGITLPHGPMAPA